MSKPNRIALIDADTILYAIASASEMCAKGQGPEGKDLWFQVTPLAQCYEKAVERIECLLDATRCETGYIAITAGGGRNFRYELLPTYKHNRKDQHRPTILKELQDAFIDTEYGGLKTIHMDCLEADDVVGIMSGVLSDAGKEPVICSEDKDLRSIPGLLYQRGEMHRIDRASADRFHLYQTLIGDTTDGYTGCPGIGPKKAEALLSWAEERDFPPAQTWALIVAKFAAAGKDEDYALSQARVARILRQEDWNPKTKRPILWTPRRAEPEDSGAKVSQEEPAQAA